VKHIYVDRLYPQYVKMTIVRSSLV